VILGSIQDYTYASELDRYIRLYRDTPRVREVKGNDALQQLVKLLQAGRIDVFVENAPVVQYTIQQMRIGQGQIKEAGAPRMGVRLFVPFSPKFEQSQRYAAIYDQRIGQLRNSGRLEKILKKYQINDWVSAAQHIDSFGKN
jgi:polar amino acid transport system substrate-binding protein